MKYTEYKDPKTQETVITINIKRADLTYVQLLKSDRILIEECSKSNKISDKLLCLETIARKIEEQSLCITID